MKISYDWLKEFVDINISPEKLAEILTMRSFKVEEIIYQGEGLDKFVVGEILEIKKHSDAKKWTMKQNLTWRILKNQNTPSLEKNIPKLNLKRLLIRTS